MEIFEICQVVRRSLKDVPSLNGGHTVSKTQFLLHKMFQEGYKVTLSDEEIARRCGISAERVREYIEQDIEAGMLFEKLRTFNLLSDIFGSGCSAKKRPAFWASLLRTKPKL